VSEVKPALARLKVSEFDSAEEAERLETILDIASRLGAPEEIIGRYRNQLAEHVSDVSRKWLAGQKYFEAGQYRTAAEKWRAEAESQKRPDLWRQLMLAEAGAELGPKVLGLWMEDLRVVIEALNQDRLEDAKTKINKEWQDRSHCAAINVLRCEVDARLALRVAEQKASASDARAWQEAAQKYRAAEALLKGVPYATLLRTELGWPDLEAEARTLDGRIEQDRRDLERTEELRKAMQGDSEAGLHQLAIALKHRPNDPTLLRLCVEEAKRKLDGEQPRSAQDLLELAYLYGSYSPSTHTGQEIRAALNVARSRVQAQAIRASELERICADAETAVASGKYDEATAALSQLTPSEIATLFWMRTLKTRLEELFAVALRTENGPALVALLPLLALVDPDRSRDAARQQLCNQIPVERLAVRIEQAVQGGHWREVLALANQLPPSMAHPPERFQRVTDQLSQRFENAAASLNFGGLHLLLPILAVLDPDSTKIAFRQQIYTLVERKVIQDEWRWAKNFLRHLDARRQASPDSFPGLISEIENAERLVDPDAGFDPFRQSLRRTRAELEQAHAKWLAEQQPSRPFLAVELSPVAAAQSGDADAKQHNGGGQAESAKTEANVGGQEGNRDISKEVMPSNEAEQLTSCDIDNLIRDGYHNLFELSKNKVAAAELSFSTAKAQLSTVHGDVAERHAESITAGRNLIACLRGVLNEDHVALLRKHDQLLGRSDSEDTSLDGLSGWLVWNGGIHPDFATHPLIDWVDHDIPDLLERVDKALGSTAADLAQTERWLRFAWALLTGLGLVLNHEIKRYYQEQPTLTGLNSRGKQYESCRSRWRNLRKSGLADNCSA
jgi:hypothetical protein